MKSATKQAVGWLSAAEAAAYLGFGEGPKAMDRFYHFIMRHKPRKHRIGRSLRFRQVDLDACVDAEPQVEESPLRMLAGGRR